MPAVGTFRVCAPGRPPFAEAVVEGVAEAVALPSVLVTMLGSLIEAWPRQISTHPPVATRLLGPRTTRSAAPRVGIACRSRWSRSQSSNEHWSSSPTA